MNQYIRATGRVSPARRDALFLNCYPLRLNLYDGNAALVGRGSFGLVQHFHLVLGQTYPDPIIEVGNFCEAATCKIVLGGEHRNDKIFNNSLGSFSPVRKLLSDKGTDDWKAVAPKPTKIGHGVILSANGLILQGAHIGNGAVIGAGSTVTRSPIADFVIAAGNPARRIRSRLNALQKEQAELLAWWDWDATCLFENIQMLVNAEDNFDTLMRLKRLANSRHRLVIDLKQLSESKQEFRMSITGYEQDGVFIPIEEAPPQIRKYFSQLTAPAEQELVWVPDIFQEVAQK